MRKTLKCVGTLAVAVAMSLQPAVTAASADDAGQTVLLSADEALAAGGGATPEEAAELRSMYRPLSDEEVTQLADGTPQSPTAVRTVLPLEGAVLVADIDVSAIGGGITVYAIPRTALDSPVTVASAGVNVLALAYEAVATSPYTSVTNTASGAADPLCGGCVAAAGGAAAVVGVTCAVGSLIPGVGLGIGLVCVGVGGVLGAGVGVACTANKCSANIQPGFSGARVTCEFNRCDLKATVQNGTNRQLTSLGSSGDWLYPAFAVATLDSGGYASEYVDSSNASLFPTSSSSAGQVYQWTHTSAQPKWATCTTTVRFSITAQWSDYQFKSTGWKPWAPKPALTSCPNWRTVV